MISVSGLYNGWIEELARIAEPLVQRSGGRPAYVVVQSGGGYGVLRHGRKGMNDLGPLDPQSAAGASLLKKMKNQQVELRLDPDQVLDKHIGLPAAGQQYIEAILRHQIERLTPWSADNVAFDYVVGEGMASDGQVPIRLVATARGTVAEAIRPFSEAGVRLERVGTAGDPVGEASPVDLQDSGKAERVSALRRTVSLSLAAAAVVLIALGGLQSWRAYVAAQEFDEVQDAVDRRRAVIAEAVARTTASDEYRALSARKSSSLPMVVLLDELSATIPDNTYLTELNVEGNTVRINGVSREAPALISLLEDADALVDARFAAPTTRAESGKSDTFQIVAQIGAPADAPVDAAAGAGQ
ncbi:PilN domain-containing protein [Microbaculum marinum]|uniref:PilN domain-containing protein n=1 Tax=Microbaculum marinum TaxID=1764581 RepID=A0AAW9RYH8_9HYPH